MFEKVTDTVFNVGCNDPELDLFESQYQVPNGVAYNSYIVKGSDKTVVVDSMDLRKGDEWLENIEEVMDGKPIDYLLIQHLEPDHSGTIEAFLKKYPDTKLVASKKAISMLPQFVDIDLNGRTIEVKEGDTLDLGDRQLSFITAPMVHWPEVIMSYDNKDKIFFAADAFGKFGTRDADEPWDDEARRYFINIVGKYGPQVQAVLKKAGKFDIETICSLHGPVLTEDLGHYLSLYDTWSRYEPETEGIFIAVASIHGHTNKVAEKVKEILEAKGQKVELMDLTREDVHQAVANAYRYPKTVLIACSYDAGVFPPMERMLNILSHKNFQKRTIAMVENGSWAPTAAKTMKSLLESCKNLQLVEPVVTIRTSLKESDIPALTEMCDHLIEA